jgi:retron-type reverse transcriptase
MTDALTSLGMSTELRKVADRAKREPAARFHSLAHLIDQELLAGAFARRRGNAAIGVDGITKEQYGQDLQNNLRDLHERLKTNRHQSIPGVHFPKEKQGKTRPIGNSATEDNVVHRAFSGIAGNRKPATDLKVHLESTAVVDSAEIQCQRYAMAIARPRPIPSLLS